MGPWAGPIWLSVLTYLNEGVYLRVSTFTTGYHGMRDLQPSMDENYWPNRAKVLVGKTVAKVYWMSDEDAESNMWDSKPVIIEFTDGSWIAPMADDEGNDGGALCGTDHKTGEGIELPVFRKDN